MTRLSIHSFGNEKDKTLHVEVNGTIISIGRDQEQIILYLVQENKKISTRTLRELEGYLSRPLAAIAWHLFKGGQV